MKKNNDYLLDVRNLTMVYKTRQGSAKAVDDVTFSVKKGEAVGLVGESGCGKTSLAFSLIKLLPKNAEIVSGSVSLKGTDLVKLSETDIKPYRWKGISMVFQAAMNSLNPCHRVGDQISEAILHHEDVSRKEADGRVAELYELVGLDPGRRRDYPHQYSGGMKQRAVIAMALACRPDIIIADEPTTALDVIVQDQIIEELAGLQKKLGMTMIYISHDIAVIAETCARIGVMYAGKLVELATTRELFGNPKHPYTKALLDSYPSLHGAKSELKPVEGEPPNLINPSPGCKFHPRCPSAEDKCTKIVPVYKEYETGHWTACHFPFNSPSPAGKGSNE